MTTLNFALTRTAAREWSAGDEVVVTKLDHDANVAPWLELAHDKGLDRALLRARRRVPARPRPPALAALGADARRRVPVGLERRRHGHPRRRDRRARARRRRARVGRRGALRAARPDRRRRGRRRRPALLAVQVLRAAPGARVRSARAARALAAVQGAAAPTSRPPATGTRRARSRTSCSPGFIAACEYLDWVGWEFVSAHERSARRAASSTACRSRGRCTARRRWTSASRRSRSRRRGSRRPRRPRGSPSAGFAVWDGNYYALEVMKHLGLPDGAIRVGIVHYNTEDEVDRLLAALAWRTGLLRHAALEEARREAGRRGRRLLHDAPRRAARAAAAAEGDARAGRRALDRLAEEGVEARDRPRLRRGAGGRPRRRPRRQQELRDRRRLAGAAVRLPAHRPLSAPRERHRCRSRARARAHARNPRPGGVPTRRPHGRDYPRRCDAAVPTS